jgi:hypothetical protein
MASVRPFAIGGIAVDFLHFIDVFKGRLLIEQIVSHEKQVDSIGFGLDEAVSLRSSQPIESEDAGSIIIGVVADVVGAVFDHFVFLRQVGGIVLNHHDSWAILSVKTLPNIEVVVIDVD